MRLARSRSVVAELHVESSSAVRTTASVNAESGLQRPIPALPQRGDTETQRIRRCKQ